MVNVDTVYQTVLLILNQQQSGYMTPDEFNKAGTQAQLTIFEGYASDLNQQYRLSQNDTEYSNRIKNIEQKLQFFQRTATPVIIATTSSFNILDTTAPIDAPVVAGTTDTLYRLGSVFYKNQDLGQYVQPNELRQLLLSPLTQPTTTFPIYTYENNIITSYLAKPRNIKWDFTTDITTGAYLYAAGSSIQFDLDVTEQDELILRILAYAGLIIQDPTIISAASQAVAAQDANEKQ